MAIMNWEQPLNSSTLQRVVGFEQAKYPDMEVTIMRDESGDFTSVAARKRGENTRKVWQISNTFLATVTPSQLADDFHKFMKGSPGAVTHIGGNPNTSWTDEWIKKNVKG